MNKAILIGNLTRDPETRTLSSGGIVCNFTIAINRRFTNQQGVREADFIPIVAWRQQAEFCSRYLTKGRKVSVVGTIQTRTYDAQDGTKRYVTEVVADEVEAIGSSGQEGPVRSAQGDASAPPEPTRFTPKPTQAPAQAPVQAPAPGGFGDMDDDELPF
ncbi:MAG: single-stranded DNA-binding protein [Clostridia bacterium]